MFAVTVRGMSGVSTASVSGSEGDDAPEGPSLREGVLTVHTQIVFTSESVSLSGAGAAAGNKTLFDKVSVVYTLSSHFSASTLATTTTTPCSY
jgi:hypothetical protein